MVDKSKGHQKTLHVGEDVVINSTADNAKAREKTKRLRKGHSLKSLLKEASDLIREINSAISQELCRRQELTELVIDSTELQQLAQRFQFPEPADHQHLRSGKLDEVETHTRGKKVDDKAMHKGLAPSLQHPALVLGSSLQLQLDWNKDYWRLLPECRSRQQNKDSSTVDKKKDGQGRAGSKEQDPEAAPITSVYQGGRWNNQSCSIDPLAPTHSMPQLQGVTARVLAADQAADQLLAEKD
ncbi:hypothetical protein ABBQ32_005359 [Trebouxia sp. C0010 RCD-2024]